MKRLKTWIPAFAGMTFLCLSSVIWGADTTIKGQRMELLNKGESIVFSGGVRLERGTDEVKAERMTTNQTRDKVNAQGNVKLFRRVSGTETWNGFSDVGFYNTKEGTGYLIGTSEKAHIKRTEILSSTMTRVMDIFAKRFDFDKDAKSSQATGDVYGKTIDPQTQDVYEFWAPKADYDGHKRVIVLSSGAVQPKLLQVSQGDRREITGDIIIYSMDSENLVSDGQSQAVFFDAGEEKEKL